jgi:hypothetical protein
MEADLSRKLIGWILKSAYPLLAVPPWHHDHYPLMIRIDK